MSEHPIARYPSGRGLVCLWSDVELLLKEVEQLKAHASRYAASAELQRYDWTIDGSVLREGSGRWCLWSDVEAILRENERLKEIIGMLGRGEIRAMYAWDAAGGRMAYWAWKTKRIGDYWHDSPMVGPFPSAAEAILEAAKGPKP